MAKVSEVATSNDILAFYARLITLTQQEQINWQVADERFSKIMTDGNTKVSGPVFVAD